MPENNEKKYGRNIFDLIAEHPKYTLSIFLTVILVIIGLVFFRVPLKIGNVEVGDKPTILHDTIIKTKVDTQWVKAEPKSIQSRSSFAKPKQVPIQNTKASSTEPSNSNIGVNNGIIGNNNDVNINVNEIRRKLDNSSKSKLLELVNQTLEKNNLDKNSEISISSKMSDSEALGFAREISKFLRESNYSVQDEIGQFQSSPIVVGVRVGFDRYKKCVEIKVGYRTDS